MTGARPDADLVLLAARDGDHAALGTILERHVPMLRILCARMLDDAAEVDDVLQETALAALFGIGRLRSGDRVGAWLAGIALNLCRHVLRDRRRAARRPHPTPAPRLAPDEEAIDAAIAEAVRLAVATLPKGQRDAVLLAHDVVLHGDGGGKVPALRRSLHGRSRVARTLLV